MKQTLSAIIKIAGIVLVCVLVIIVQREHVEFMAWGTALFHIMLLALLFGIKMQLSGRQLKRLMTLKEHLKITDEGISIHSGSIRFDLEQIDKAVKGAALTEWYAGRKIAAGDCKRTFIVSVNKMNWWLFAALISPSSILLAFIFRHGLLFFSYLTFLTYVLFSGFLVYKLFFGRAEIKFQNVEDANIIIEKLDARWDRLS